MRAGWTDSGLLVDWCDLRDRRFTAPFFDQTVNAALRRPYPVLFRQQTHPDVLAAFHALHPAPPPSGFIFHLSRSGSTLITQMLAALPETIVISEPHVLEGLLRAPFHDPAVDDERRIAWIRGLFSALGQPRFPHERHLIVKFESWHILDLPLLRRAFPTVPWIFVYRDPLEVLVSQSQQLAARLMPGPVEARLLGWDLVATLLMPREEYVARVLGTWCRAALDQREPPSLLVEYCQLPAIVESSLLDLFGLAPDQAGRAALATAARFHAKQPEVPFHDDGAAKQAASTPAMRQAVDRWVRPLYEELEALRLARHRRACASRGSGNGDKTP